MLRILTLKPSVMSEQKFLSRVVENRSQFALGRETTMGEARDLDDNEVW